MNISEQFFSEIDRIAKLEIPEEVISRAKKSLLDYLAVTCAGATFQKEKIEKYFEFADPEEGAYRVIGTGKNLTLKEAVFLNGLNGHALDFDDGTNSGIIHLGSPIFSLLLPLSQKYHICIEKVLKSAVIGYEASYTLAVSIQPKHKALGYHATGTCGVIGAALAASYMLDFTVEERFNVFAIACVSSTGMLKVLDDGSELKPYNVAKSALLALSSIQMAKAGFKSHHDPLGGYRGFLKMMVGDENIPIKSVLLNGTYAIMKSYTKPYASCRYTHPSVEAAINMRKEHNIVAEDVINIDVKTYDLAVSGHDHQTINGAYSAKMSTPYSTSVALIYGKAGLQEFGNDVLSDEQVKLLTQKVIVSADKELSDIFPQKQSAIVTIYTTKGEYTKRIDFPKGEPENPMSENEFHTRFDNLMSFANIKYDAYSSIYELVNHIEKDASELINKL